MEYGFLLRVSVQPEMHDVIIPDVYSLVPQPLSSFPQYKKQGSFPNYTIPCTTDLFLEVGVQEICSLFAD